MHTSDRVTLARLPSGVRIETTVHTYGSEDTDDGPTLYVQAAQHGREVNGAAVLRRFHERLDPTEVPGRIVAVPVANPPHLRPCLLHDARTARLGPPEHEPRLAGRRERDQ